MRVASITSLSCLILLAALAPIYSGPCPHYGVEEVEANHTLIAKEKCTGMECPEFTWGPISAKITCTGADGKTTVYCVTDYYTRDAHTRAVPKEGFETYTNSKYQDRYYHGWGCCFIPFIDCWVLTYDHNVEWDLYQERPCG